MRDHLYRKNEIVRVTIEDMTGDGEGIGHVDGYTLFVKDAVIGDEIRARITKAKKNYGYARIEEVLVSSAARVPARCPKARSCGGCRLQELDYGEQLKFKESLVRRNLERIGGFSDIPMEPIIGMEDPWRYRNKAQYPVGLSKKDGRILAGYYAGRTHSIIDIRDCALSPSENADILDTVVRFAGEFGIPPYDEENGQGIIRHVLVREGFISGEVLVCLAINADTLPQAENLVDRLLALPMEGKCIKSVCLNINRKRTNVILGDRTVRLYGDPWAVAFADLTGRETVFDLFCGIGTISHFLAAKAKEVYGVEIVPQAIEDAKANAERNGIGNVKFFAAAAEDVAERGYFDRENPLVRPDVIVLDPPRKGCEGSLLKTIRKLGPDRVVYVSCDSATLARDLKILCMKSEDGSQEASYEIRRVRPCDMFPHSTHIETIVLLQKLNS